VAMRSLSLGVALVSHQWYEVEVPEEVLEQYPFDPECVANDFSTLLTLAVRSFDPGDDAISHVWVHHYEEGE